MTNADPYVRSMIAAIYRRCDEIGECQVWRGALAGQCAPTMVVDGEQVLVRRRVFVLTRGYVPDGRMRVVRMTCGNPRCVSEHHMADSSRSTVAKVSHKMRPRGAASYFGYLRGRITRGTALNFEKARAIRADSRPVREIAAAYGCAESTVRSVKAHKTWRESWPASSVFTLAAA